MTVATKPRVKDACRFRFYEQQLRQQAAEADNTHDRVRLIQQADSFRRAAMQSTEGERP